MIPGVARAMKRTMNFSIILSQFVDILNLVKDEGVIL